MTLNEEKREELNELIKPVQQWLLDNTHPHTKIIVDGVNAELVEGVCNFDNTDVLVIQD